ncbi:MAG TPA: hypothetical protein VIW03_10865 [Anaeromyxobacter sp.]
MKRAAALSLPIAAVVVALAWPTARGGDPETSVCALMTPAKLLEQPGLAREYADALRSGDAGQVGRIEDAIREIRTVHGCGGDVALPAEPHAEPALPPGHPPVRAPSFRDDRRMREAPLFQGPGIVTI